MKQKKEKSKILIVEDDEDTREIFSKVLLMNGFKVVSAVNGKEGLEKVASEKPDLILLDILMPVMDGFTMLKELRKGDEYAKNVPVILLTNLSAGRDDIIAKVVEDKPSYYIVKASFSPKQVVEKVKEVLANSQ